MRRLVPAKQHAYVENTQRVLRRLASQRKVISYQELMNELGGPGRGYIGGVLEEVCEIESAAGRPLLTVIVVHAATNDPGPGYWMLSMVPRVSNQRDRRILVEREQQRVFDYWANHSG